jgi:uncharacterized membrane protein
MAVVLFAFSAIFYVIRPWSAATPGPYYFPFFFPFGWIFGFFWIFIIFWVLRWLFIPWGWGYGRRRWRYRDESYYTLRQRYARGEISKDEFEQMTQTLDKQAL